MGIRYLYIDDDNLAASKSKIQGFEVSGELDIVTEQHKGTWEEQLSSIKNSSIDGLILDLRLNDFPNEKDERANFRGTSIAQEIRTQQKEKNLPEFPIILFSANDKLEKSLESSGKDLFDICIDKTSIESASSFDDYSPKLTSLAHGYKILSGGTNIQEWLDINPEKIDERFLSELKILKEEPSHAISQFIIHELLEKQGLLIDEIVLAARLGVDIKNSDDWNKLKETLSHAKYTGVFNGGWQRWWMPLIDYWWHEEIKAGTYLRSTSAGERVRIIKEKLGIKEVYAAVKIDRADSDEFWTICQAHKAPLDPVDGLVIIGQEKLYPWQEPNYVSIDAALKSKNKENGWIDVAAIEYGYLEELKKTYARERRL